MSYTVLARRYRSANFEDIVGQDSIAKTLRNAIESDRTAHAYLFTGTRGVGKTSMARIFARELNQSDALTEQAAIGDAILRGEDLDVIEIDGASNRGVQEARDLIASAGLAPTRCKYRIYIIDEVHMLTTPAFNALLKTMEEPPSHVKFILCTTEPHKVPATIQSRCQRFDFKAIASKHIANHLTYVLEQEGIKTDVEVVAEVARLGNGSMRDALSILDRLLASGASTIKFDDMENLLGLPSQKSVSSLCSAISKSDMHLAFDSADNLIASGITLDRALEVIANTLRHSLIARVCGIDSPLLELSDESKEEAVEIGALLDEATLTHMIALCDASSRSVRRAGSGRALFDATIARLCMSGELAEAGGTLKSTPASKQPTKKKRIAAVPAPPPKRALKAEENPQVVSEPVAQKTSVSWTDIQSTIATTPGLKRIAQYFTLVSFEEKSLRLAITDAGRESMNYIFAQKQKIEEVASATAKVKITLTIDASSSVEESKVIDTPLDEVEGHALVQAARGLFNGTIVQVKNNSKDES
ncbi:MAG: DNA polymerase III subunit gamma/tau [Planctomycetes bacterium]|nr:DNA polymerase III subunit gamma/tau [Planctomycetota bacterium]